MLRSFVRNSVLLAAMGICSSATHAQVTFQSGTWQVSTVLTGGSPGDFSGLMQAYDGDYDVDLLEQGQRWRFGVGYFIANDQSSFGVRVSPGSGAFATGTSMVVGISFTFTADFLVGPNGWTPQRDSARVHSTINVASLVSIPDISRPEPGVRGNADFSAVLPAVGFSGFVSPQVVLDESLPGPSTRMVTFDEIFAERDEIIPGRTIRVSGRYSMVTFPAVGSPSFQTFATPWEISVVPAPGTFALLPASLVVLARRRRR